MGNDKNNQDDDKKKKSERRRSNQQPSNDNQENTDPRSKKTQEETSSKENRQVPAASLSSSESNKKEPVPAMPNRTTRHRPGTRSTPQVQNPRQQTRRSIRSTNEDESVKNSASTQHSNQSALSLTVTQADPNESLQTYDTDEAAPEINVHAIHRLEEFTHMTLSQPFNKFVAEYTKLIKSIVPFDWQIQAFKNNKKKNRYADIFCLDSTRVILRDYDGRARKSGSYIHANYVSSDEIRRTYILAQGPKKETVVDFWHMVWQSQCPVIVMLCDYTENGKKKCVQYLPQNNTTVQIPSSTGKMTIRTAGGKKHCDGSLVETQLTLVEDGKELSVVHWKWTGWADFQAPTEFQTIFRLLKEMRHTQRGFPIIHCSAGVGRSGTLIALEVCLGVLRSGKPLVVKNCVETVRRQRAHSIQTPVQYMFIYRALLDMATSNDIITPAQLKDFHAAYESLAKKYK